MIKMSQVYHMHLGESIGTSHETEIKTMYGS